MLKKIINTGAIMAMTLGFLANCSSNSSSDDEPQIFERPAYKHISLTTRQSEGVGMNNEFAFKMFKDINANPYHAAEANKIFSPYSLFTLFSMLANGDDGQTADLILTALSGTGTKMTTEELNSLNSFLLSELPAVDPTTNVAIANSLWPNSLYKFYPEYLTTLADYYGAEIFPSEFSDTEKLRYDINSWVEQRTNGLIKDFLNPGNMTEEFIYNVNTTYFKGVWTVPFPSENTSNGTFHSIKGDTKVKMMKIENEFKYGRGEKEEVIRLPYGGGNFDMTVILPKENVDIDEFVLSLSPEYFSTMSDLSLRNVELTLPKFSVESKIELHEKDFYSTGLSNVIPGGIFSKICEDRGISFLYGLTFTHIIVDESGTEGGAASTVIGEGWNGEDFEIPVLKMTVDRPFIFIIRETSTGAILFMGKITEL